MKELKKVWVWDEPNGIKREARLLFSDPDIDSCVAITEDHYDKYISGQLNAPLKWKHWEEIKEPKMRLMNQKEIWYAIQNMKHPIVVSYITSPEYSSLPQTFNFNSAITEYRWAELYIDGTHGNWKKFEVEE